MRIRTYVVNNKKEFDIYFDDFKALAEIKANPGHYITGFDIEMVSRSSHPTSHEKSLKWVECNDNDQVVCTVQIATREMCLVINLVNIGKPIPTRLISLFKSANWIKMGVGVDHDLHVISQNYNLKGCLGGWSLDRVCAASGIKQPNLKEMYERFVGNMTINKDIICDWTEELTEKHLEYAAKDAIASYELGMALLSPLSNKIKKYNRTNRIEIINAPITNNIISRLNEHAQRKGDIVSYTFTNEKGGFKAICTYQGVSTQYISGSKKTAKTGAAKLMYDYIN